MALTTAEIRENYIDSDSMLSEHYDRQYAEFDEWLTAHDADLVERCALTAETAIAGADRPTELWGIAASIRRITA